MKLFVRVSYICGLALAGMIFTGCVSTQNPTFNDNPVAPYPNTSSTNDTYAPLFRVGETVIVTFSGVPDQELVSQPHNETIKDDGTISLPYIGNVKAAGLTPGQLQDKIQRLYVPKYYVRLTVTVNSQDRVYYVGGLVNHPGPQVYLGQTTVTKAIQAAGDFTDFASHRVWLIHPDGQRVKENCDKALADPSLDLPVYPGDQIQVPRRLF
jgi:polysaccharide biosynthesis/export protein